MSAAAGDGAMGHGCTTVRVLICIEISPNRVGYLHSALTSENAVMTQVMAALCVYLLLAFLKFQSRITRSLQQITRLLQLNLFTRRSLLALLYPADRPESPPPQLRLGLVRY
jgi:hypothetical protein